MKIVLLNGNTLIGQEIIKKHVVINDGKIVKVVDVDQQINTKDAAVIDCQGKYVFPGLIDLHVHGGGGGEASTLSTESYKKIVKSQVKFGTTSIVLTSIGLSDQELEESVNYVKETNDSAAGANILGLHLEGPWISPKKIGYLNKDLFEFNANPVHAQELCDKTQGYLKIVTLAPELENIDKVIKVLVDNNVVASIGHTEANYQIAQNGIEYGAKAFTHLWNMSGPVQSREPGVVGLGMSSDDTYIELVADGYHVHPANVKNTVLAKAKDKVCLVTDAMIVTGTQLDSYSFMGIDDIKVVNGRTCGPNNAIIGSILTLNKAIKNVKEWSNLDLATVVNMASANPAKYLGVYPQKGAIGEGFDADLAIFDTDLDCTTSIVNGVIYNNK